MSSVGICVGVAVGLGVRVLVGARVAVGTLVDEGAVVGSDEPGSVAPGRSVAASGGILVAGAVGAVLGGPDANRGHRAHPARMSRAKTIKRVTPTRIESGTLLPHDDRLESTTLGKAIKLERLESGATMSWISAVAV